MNETYVLVPVQGLALILKAVVHEPEIVAIRLFYRALEIRDEGCRGALKEMARILAEVDSGDGAGPR